MASKEIKTTYVSMSKELLVEVKEAFSKAYEAHGSLGYLMRVNEVGDILSKDGDIISVDFGKIIEWRNSISRESNPGLVEKLNFNFQYFMYRDPFEPLK
jgi:hypothetical protein